MSEEHTPYETQDGGTILRKETRAGYTHIANDLCEREGLSFRAKGIALVLLSKPNNWNIKISYLMRIGDEGEKTIRAALQELAAFGFLMRKRERNDKGQLRTVTLIADYPAYINIGTTQSRIRGYDTKTDLPQTDMSVADMSENRGVGEGDVIITTDQPTTNKKKDSVTNVTGRFDFMEEIEKPEPTEASKFVNGDSGVDEPTQNLLYEGQPKKRKRKGDVNPNTRPIMDAYVEALGYEPIHYAKEVGAAKKLAERGYTPADVAAAYDLIKQKPYWSTEHLPLQKVAEQIPALHQAFLQGKSLTQPPVKAKGIDSLRNLAAELGIELRIEL